MASTWRVRFEQPDDLRVQLVNRLTMSEGSFQE